MTVAGGSGDIEIALAEARGKAPWRRALRSLLRKRLAVISLILICIIYGAGSYTMLDAFGAPTGLQDPTTNNLAARDRVDEGETIGAFLQDHDASLEEIVANNRRTSDTVRLAGTEVEPLASFLTRHGITVDVIAALNPTVADRFGPLTEETVLPELTLLTIPGPSDRFSPLREETVLPAGTLLVVSEDETLQGPSSRHLFGTDRNGRDMFSRTLFSARTTLIFSILAFLLGDAFLGLGLGLWAGYRGGWVDAVIMRVGDVFLAIPGLLVLIVISAVLREQWTDWIAAIDDFLGMTFLIDQGIDHISLLFVAVSFLGWVLTARFVRAQVLALREQEFILAAESIGAGTPRILVRHLLPGVLPWIIMGVSASLGAAAGAEVGLTFLGLGIQPPTASFGAMIADAGGSSTFNLHPHLLLVPGVTVAVLIFSFNLLGDAVNDVVNPRGR